jgi:hypothetical protein
VGWFRGGSVAFSQVKCGPLTTIWMIRFKILRSLTNLSDKTDLLGFHLALTNLQVKFLKARLGAGGCTGILLGIRLSTVADQNAPLRFCLRAGGLRSTACLSSLLSRCKLHLKDHTCFYTACIHSDHSVASCRDRFHHSSSIWLKKIYASTRFYLSINQKLCGLQSLNSPGWYLGRHFIYANGKSIFFALVSHIQVLS